MVFKQNLDTNILQHNKCSTAAGGHRGHDRMVVGITTTCAISAYHH
jgi:hypothetical protein